MIAIRVNVPPELRDHSEVKWRVEDLSEKFNSSWFDNKRRLILCLHEGTHLVYARLLGFEPKLYGPSVQYYADRDEFQQTDGSIQALPDEIELNADPVLVAKHFMAPAYVEEALLAHRTKEQIWWMARGDLRNYNNWFCRRVREKGDIPRPFPNIRELVYKDCRSPKFRKQLWDAAHEFEVRVFGRTQN